MKPPETFPTPSESSHLRRWLWVVLGSLVVLAAVLEIWSIRTITVTADPAIIAPGASSVIRIKVLNRLGFEVPFRYRRATFTTEGSSDDVTITPNPLGTSAVVSGRRHGEIHVSVMIEGELLPYLVVIRVEALLA